MKNRMVMMMSGPVLLAGRAATGVDGCMLELSNGLKAGFYPKAQLAKDTIPNDNKNHSHREMTFTHNEE
jgi:hypothetical protein